MIWSVRFERILAVTAQGVETAVQRDLLNDLGCDEMQGYFFGRPMEVDEATALARGELRHAQA